MIKNFLHINLKSETAAISTKAIMT